jgi:hypothetical protein
MNAPYGHAARILELAGELRELADKIERETAKSIVETRTFGLLCNDYSFRENAPDVAPDDEIPVGHVEPVPASAMIPPRELNRADRGAE